MRHPTLLTHSLLLLTLTLPQTHAKTYTKSKDAILLSKIRTLTLQSTKSTSHRRLAAIPQLTCVGGNARGLYDVDVMRCTNSGSEYDAEDIQWTCKASLPAEFKLGSTEVVCEGYDSPEDPFVLKGSCGVEYRLVLTEAGEEKYGKRGGWGLEGVGTGNVLSLLWSWVFYGVFIAVACLIIYRIFFRDRGVALPGGGRGFGGFGGGGGGGGGGWGGGNDPPPPYTPRAPPRSKPSSTPRSAPSSSSSGPSSWYGTAAAAAAGYAAGQYMGRRGERQREPQRTAPSSSRSPFGGLFGGGGGSGGPPSAGAGAGGSAFASGPSPSGPRYESTGFGGTRRR